MFKTFIFCILPFEKCGFFLALFASTYGYRSVETDLASNSKYVKEQIEHLGNSACFSSTVSNFPIILRFDFNML